MPPPPVDHQDEPRHKPPQNPPTEAMVQQRNKTEHIQKWPNGVRQKKRPHRGQTKTPKQAHKTIRPNTNTSKIRLRLRLGSDGAHHQKKTQDCSSHRFRVRVERTAPHALPFQDHQV